MTDMIDSKKEQIQPTQIMLIAAENTGDFKKYDKKVVLPAMITEMSQPNTAVKQFGNTLFIVHQGENGQGFFKALNADTARNYLENSYVFLDWAKNELGMNTLLTEFTDSTIMNIFKMISAKPPFPNMGYQTFKMKSGKTRVVLNLGGSK